MTTRVRRPTDEVGTELFDPTGRPALFGAPPPATAQPATPFESFERDATEVTARSELAAVEHATPTYIDPQPIEHGVPVAPMRAAARSEPIRVISMKDRPDAQTPRPEELRVPLHAHLRSIADVSGRPDSAAGLGNLAPPRDPRQARARRVRSNLVWGCIGLALACAISLAIWLVAGR